MVRHAWLLVVLLLAGVLPARAQDVVGSYDISGDAGGGQGHIRRDGDDLVLTSDLRAPARTRAGAGGGSWTFTGAAGAGLAGTVGDLGGGAGATAPRTIVVTQVDADRLDVEVRDGAAIVARERWTRSTAARLHALAPDRERFVPFRADGPNTVTVRCLVEPTDQAVDLVATVVDRSGREVSRRTLRQARDEGQGVAFTWDGRTAGNACVDARRSPYRVSFSATIAGARVSSQAVQVVVVPRLDACIVVSGVDGGELGFTNKVVAHDARVRLVAVVRAVVAGARPEEPGRTERANFVALDDVRAAALPKAGRVALARWDDALWGPLELSWQEVRARGLHSPAYRATQNQQRSTRDGEFTNVVSNGPDEGRWLGRDTIEYTHHPAGSGPELEADTSPGTVRYRVDVTHAASEGAVGSPGRPDPQPTTATAVRSGLLDGFSVGLGGAGPEVHRVSRRGPSTNRLLAELETYRGVPWLYGSLPEQVQEFIGYDCADLAFGAARRAGLTTRTRFTNANNLCKLYTRQVGKIPTLRFDLMGGLHDVKTGDPVDLPAGGATTNVQPGDVVFFDWDGDGTWDHTTVLWDAPSGALDQTARFAWAHHDPTATDGFHVGPLSELVHPAARLTTRMAVRRF